MNDLNIAIAQINPIVGDIAYNRDKIIEFASRAKDADIILFPELCVSGYPPDDLVKKPSFIEAISLSVQEIAEALKDLHAAVIIGAPISKDGKLYNAVHLLHSGKIQHTVLKHKLANYDEFDEARVFTEGPITDVTEWNGHRLGLIICEDLWHEDNINHLIAQKPDVILVPNGSTFTVSKHDKRIARAREIAVRAGAPVYYANQTGGQDEMVFDGGSFVMGEDGELLEQLPFFEEFLSSSSFLRKQESTSPIELDPSLRWDDGLIYKALTLATRDYVTKNGFTKVLIGLSGGIDSALVAAIAVDALGAENVECIMLPSEFTSPESLEDAKECARWLGCSYEIIEIKDAVKLLETLIPDLEGLAHENTQSRLRGLILMALSNMRGALLLSTGNKSEMAVGYATLYGDMNGAFNPLKDIYKTKVFDLARERSIKPERIITKPPSAELREDQKDQDSLPDYEILDIILEGLVDQELSISDLVARGYDKETVTRVNKLLNIAEYKRFQAAPGPKITDKAFGRCRRYPMTNGFCPFSHLHKNLNRNERSDNNEVIS